MTNYAYVVVYRVDNKEDKYGIYILPCDTCRVVIAEDLSVVHAKINHSDGTPGYLQLVCPKEYDVTALPYTEATHEAKRLRAMLREKGLMLEDVLL